MGQLVVIEQRARFVGHDEFVGGFTVADGIRIALVVFHETDDFKFQRLTVVRLDDEDVAQFQGAGGLGVVRAAVRTFDDDLLMMDD